VGLTPRFTVGRGATVWVGNIAVGGWVFVGITTGVEVGKIAGLQAVRIITAKMIMEMGVFFIINILSH
jgi:hypothetical protein